MYFILLHFTSLHFTSLHFTLGTGHYLLPDLFLGGGGGIGFLGVRDGGAHS